MQRILAVLHGGLKGMIDAVDGVQVPPQKDTQRSLRPQAQPQRWADRSLDAAAVVAGRCEWRHVDPFGPGAEGGEARQQLLRNAADAVGIEAAGVDIRQLQDSVAHLRDLRIDPLQIGAKFLSHRLDGFCSNADHPNPAL